MGRNRTYINKDGEVYDIGRYKIVLDGEDGVYPFRKMSEARDFAEDNDICGMIYRWCDNCDGWKYVMGTR